MPIVTASVGVPVTPYPMSPSLKLTSFTLIGSTRVNAWPIPLCCLEGATTIVSPNSSATCFAARIPDASTPSSLDNKIFI